MKRAVLLSAAALAAVAGLAVPVLTVRAQDVPPPAGAGGKDLLRNLLAPVGDRKEWRTIPRDLPVTVEGTAVRLAVPDAGEKRQGAAQYWIPLGSYLKDGATFTLSFRAKADAERVLGVVGQRNDSRAKDYANIGLQKRVTLTSEWQPFSVTFTAKNPLPDRNKLAFALGGGAGTVWISDVMLSPAPDGAKPDAPAAAAKPARQGKPNRPAAAPPAPPVQPDLAAIPDFGEVTLQVPSSDGKKVVPLTFVKIPAGTYRRGTTDADKATLAKLDMWAALNADETPAKEVRISRPFLLSKCEITQAQFRLIMPPGPRNQPMNPSAFKGDPNKGDGDNLPVESASWNDAQAFCAALKDRLKDGTFRLPTEAEWEYAARAGGDGPFGLGANKAPVTTETLGEYAWFSENAANKTHPVGTRKPNAWGLHDMLGNIWEWCQDDYAPDAYATLPATDPLCRNPIATERVLRGGCWFLDKRAQRVSLRGGNVPTIKNAYVGFRVARELP